MQWNDIYVSSRRGLAGEREDVLDAVADGRYDAEECKEDDYLAVRVAGRSPRPT